MNKRSKDIILGTIVALLSSGLIIFSIEYDKSFWQIVLGFILFFLPITFFSTFFSKIGAFLFVFSSVLISYFVNRYLLYDFWIGVLLALVLGGSLYFLRVRRFIPFDPVNYRKENSKSKNL